MRADRLADFNHTIRTTRLWLREIEQEMGLSDCHLAYRALRGVLFALRDRMSLRSVHYWGAELPVLIRGLLFEDYEGNEKPLPYERRDFLAQVNRELGQAGGGDPETATYAVLKVIARHMEPSASRKMRNLVPSDLRGLWPEPITYWTR